MEAADSGARQSGHSSANSSITTFSNSKIASGPEQHPSPYHPQREPLERPPPQDQSAMAAATVLTPTSQYHSQPAYPSSYPQSGPAPSVSNMISSAEPRRSGDDNEAPARQSLPSISEVISGTKPAQFHPAPHHAMQPGSSLPSPFAPMSRPFPDAEKHSSPQPLHPSSSFPPRQDALPAFSDSPRSAPFSGRPSLPPVPDRRTSPPSSLDGPPHHHAHEPQRPLEPHGMNGAYPPHPQPQHPPMPLHPSQLPPGQLPLPAYPASPRHASGQYDPRAPHSHPDESEYPPRQRYDTVNNHFENWSFQDGLSRIASASRTMFNFAEAWARVAQEQHGPPILERLPTEGEVGDMLSNAELLKRSLEDIRDMILITIQTERAREGAKAKGPYEDEQDAAMYGGGMKPQYAMTEVKKRRGRAAPPGRCHSCNRIDTPEWRRGPDGARTLCNACGLHYAKLERKRQLEARPARTKPDDRP